MLGVALGVAAAGGLAGCGTDGDGDGSDAAPGPDAPRADAGVGLGSICVFVGGDTERCFDDETVSVTIDLEEGERSIYVAHGEPLVGSSCGASEGSFRFGLHGLPATGGGPIVVTRASARFAYPSAAERCDALLGPGGTPTEASGTIDVLDEATVRGQLTLTPGSGAGTSCDGPVACSGPTPEVRVGFHVARR